MVMTGYYISSNPSEIAFGNNSTTYCESDYAPAIAVEADEQRTPVFFTP